MLHSCQCLDTVYPAEVYETEAEALAALEAYDINNCCDHEGVRAWR